MAELPHITIDGTQYPCREWKVEQQGQTIHEERTAFHGGMGDFYGRSSGGFYMSRQMHAASPGFLRLRPAVQKTIGLTNFGANADQGVFGFLEQSDTDYLYLLNGRYYWKIKLSDNSVEISNPTHDFNSPSGDTTLGRPARFEGKWYFARSIFDDAQTLDTVGNTGVADTLSDVSGIKAMHFANIQDGLVSKIARAYYVAGPPEKRSNVDLSGDGTTFAGGGEVGDGSNYIADLLSAPDGVMPCLADNIYRYSAEGEALAVQGYVGTALSSKVAYAAYDGVNSFQHGPYTYWAHSTGLWRIIGENALPVGPEASREPVNMTLDSFEAYPSGRWYSATGWGEWLYATMNDRLYYGRIVQDGIVEWQGVLFMVNGATLKCFITESGPDLWVTETSNQQVHRFALNQDGSLSGTNNYGAASTLFQFWLPAVTGGDGMRDKLKQWRKMWVDARDFSATCPLQLAAHLDRAASSTDVGTTITGSGVFERAWTPGTSDTAYEVIPTFKINPTGGYTPADPHIRAFGIEAVTAAVYRARIMLVPDELSGSLDIGSALKALQDLRNGPAVAVIAPGMTSSFNGYVTGVAEQAVSIDGGVGYAVDLFISRWDWNITN